MKVGSSSWFECMDLQPSSTVYARAYFGLMTVFSGRQQALDARCEPFSPAGGRSAQERAPGDLPVADDARCDGRCVNEEPLQPIRPARRNAVDPRYERSRTHRGDQLRTSDCSRADSADAAKLANNGGRRVELQDLTQIESVEIFDGQRGKSTLGRVFNLFGESWKAHEYKSNIFNELYWRRERDSNPR